GNNNRNITNQITIEAWIKTPATNSQWVAGKYDSNNNQGYYLFTQNGKAGFEGPNFNGTAVGSGLSLTNINDNLWHHLAGVYNNGKWEIWVDGILESTATFSTVTLPNTA